jgi:formylmethanofuran dehydrogenase subunit B
MPKPTPRAFDPRSAEPALIYVGPPVSGVPDRDLSVADLARLAFVALDVRPFTTADVPDAAIAALIDRLTASGAYTGLAPTED